MISNIDSLIQDIGDHAKIYSGRLRSHIMLAHSSSLYRNFSRKLRFFGHECRRRDDNEGMHDIGKLVQLLPQALEDHWQDPMVVHADPNSVVPWGLGFISGNKRITASHATRMHPESHIKVLLFCPVDYQPDQVLADPSPIETRDDLGRVFHHALDRGVDVRFDWYPYLDKAGFYLNIYHGLSPWQENEISQKMEPLRRWFRRYDRPRICIDDAHDSVISDDFGFWERQTDSGSADYILHLRRQMTLNMEDLVFWMDMDHNVFEDLYGRFRLSSRHKPDAHKLISVRH